VRDRSKRRILGQSVLERRVENDLGSQTLSMKELAVSAILSHDSSGTRAASFSHLISQLPEAGLRICESHDLESFGRLGSQML